MTSSVRESLVNLRKDGMFPVKFKIGWLLGDHYNNWVVAPPWMGQIKNLGEIYIVSIACIWDEKYGDNPTDTCSSGEISLCLDFHVPPTGGQAVNRIGRKLGSVRSPKGTNWKNCHIRPIAPIVTKRACLMAGQMDGQTDRWTDAAE
jgi:hypothetical protein